MLQIIVVSDSYNHFEKPILEYIKRLSKDIKIIKIKPEKNWWEEIIRKKETDKIIEIIEKEKWFFIWMDNLWDEMDTYWFHEFISKTQMRQNKITFIIGWSYWYDKFILDKYLHKSISFSMMTLPHSLALLFLLEQIYRIKSIDKNTWYHH